ncbi:thermonuclease [Cryobacterium sp. TMT1-2-1]|uniref:thermonuclease family protein n=1 Tax=Cryobacterium sp. TMT1-2-1 TaxID=1259232 RepID=UPI00106D36BD|nr:thermonuclease family protein [Cryobacterium sp. TMT1-2-1]TFD46050.1 thermonuclease [Cryobacterium sp. TMT1-2-1]
MGGIRGGSGLLVGVLALGALGFVAAQQLGPLTPALEGILSTPLGEPNDAAEPGAGAAGGAPASSGGGIPASPGNAVSMTVEHVHDGDTLFLRTNQPNAFVATTDTVKVRLVGIDTPEVGDRAECFGDEATRQLRTLLPDGSVTWITADSDPVDQYGRSLFYLWTEDGRFVNYELVAAGAAESLMIEPNDAYYPLLLAAEDAAAAAGAGMWGAC